MQTANTQLIWNIGNLALFFCFLLGAFVLILLAWFAYKYNEKAPTPRKPMSHKTETRLEVIWVVLSLLLVVFAAATTVAVSLDIQATQTETGVDGKFEVTARQFSWTFREVDMDNSTNKTTLNGPLILKVNQKYLLNITSLDVIHSFYVYELGIKQDAIRGRWAEVYVEPTEVGLFEIRCAQFCGNGHWQMQGERQSNSYVQVVP